VLQLVLLLALFGPPGKPASPGSSPPQPAARPAAPRATGSVAGRLRHRGCQSAAAGATISVVGVEASALSDAEGRFALQLPPGSFSLIIDGPNLVSDQRLDDVAVALGQTRDLGVVEVWPEERPASCGSAEPAPPTGEPVVAVAPDTPALDLPGEHVLSPQPGPEQVWVRGSPGTGPGQLGLQGSPTRDDEDALGPPSFAVGPLGSLWVLDALNRRVVRFDPRGRAAGAFAIAFPAGGRLPLEADLAVNEDGHVFLFVSARRRCCPSTTPPDACSSPARCRPPFAA
jgi:hypothetical protein